MMTVYIDVLFFVNFIINILIVEGCGTIICEDTKWYRTIIASLAGAIYAVLVFFPNLKFTQTFFMKAAVSGIMVLCAFKIKSKPHFLKLWGTFYLVSFIFGGAIVALMSFTSLGIKTGAIYSNGTIYFNLPWKVLMAGSSLTYFLITIFSRIRKKRIAKEAIGRNISIYIKGERIDMKAIIDTGNNLFDPITGVPVIVCEYSPIKKIISDEGDNLLERMKNAGLRIRLIPFSSVGEEKGMMPAFLPDMVEVDHMMIKKCVVGISENALSGEGGYQALLNPMLTVNCER